MFLKIYNILWQVILPLLKRNPRLKAGFKERVSFTHLKRADIWIQAASAGEAMLAVRLAQEFYPPSEIRILFTTTTSQGMDILQKGITATKTHPNLSFQISWFPFDAPGLMKKAVDVIRPDLMILIETEIWPAHLHELKKNGAAVIIVNGRLSLKSTKHYGKIQKFWKLPAPDKVLAISGHDAAKFGEIFPETDIGTMDNMKFDAIPALFSPRIDSDAASFTRNPPRQNTGLEKIINPEIPLSILASIRMEEEADVLFILKKILQDFPNQVVALFPRHMHRLTHWKKKLTKNRITWVLRSRMNHFPEKNSVILWDTFGELKQAYAMALTAFVGGSLKPLGGQNFIEPLGFGVATITGPYVDNFNWVGREFFKNELVKQAQDREEIAGLLLHHLKNPPDKKTLQKNADTYITHRRGGTATAIRQIQSFLSSNDKIRYAPVK